MKCLFTRIQSHYCNILQNTQYDLDPYYFITTTGLATLYHDIRRTVGVVCKRAGDTGICVGCTISLCCC